MVEPPNALRVPLSRRCAQRFWGGLEAMRGCLHPVIPFYRYVKVWRRAEQHYLANDPPLSTVGGRPLSTDEYRRLRELAEHH